MEISIIVRKLHELLKDYPFSKLMHAETFGEVEEERGPLLYQLIINSTSSDLESVKIEDLEKIDINTFEQCKKVCLEINQIWGERAIISCYDFIEKSGLVKFSLDLSDNITG